MAAGGCSANSRSTHGKCPCYLSLGEIVLYCEYILKTKNRLLSFCHIFISGNLKEID